MRRAAALVAAVVLAAGCAARAVTPAATPAVPDVVPALLQARQVPAASLVVLRGDDTVVARGYGDATPETVFQLGSISKQFLAALVMRLQEQGRLRVDDRVTRHLDDVPHLGAVRLRHLLNHTSGLREVFTEKEYQAGIEDLSRRREDLRRLVRRLPVDFEPGGRWSYSNANYMLLAEVVEKVTGRPYEVALAEHFFRPLQLSSLRACPSVPDGPGQARGHVIRDGGVVPSAPENMEFIRGDGGLCGNARDVARWLRLLATGRVVSLASFDAMAEPTPVAGGEFADYGFGLSRVPLGGRRKIAHNGAMLGFSASAAYYPDGELTVVVLTNLGDVRTESIERAVARAHLGLPAPDFTEVPLEAAARARLAGTYDIGVFRVQVTERDGRLWLEAPRPGPTTALRPLGGDRFVGEVDPDAHALWIAPDGSALRLEMGAMTWYGRRVP